MTIPTGQLGLNTITQIASLNYVISAEVFTKKFLLNCWGNRYHLDPKGRGIHVVDPVSSDFNVGRMPETIDMTEDPSGSIEPEQATDSTQIDTDPTQQSVPTVEYGGDLVDTGILPELAQDIDSLVQPDFMEEGPNGPDTNTDSVEKSDEINQVSTHPDEPDKGIDNDANIEPNSDDHVDKRLKKLKLKLWTKINLALNLQICFRKIKLNLKIQQNRMTFK